MPNLPGRSWLSFFALFSASFFLLALNAGFLAGSINIADVRLERPLSNETALACAWNLLLVALLAFVLSTSEKNLATPLQ